MVIETLLSLFGAATAQRNDLSRPTYFEGEKFSNGATVAIIVLVIVVAGVAAYWAFKKS